MELILSFIISGLAIVLYTIWRARRLDEFSKFRTSIENEYDVQNVDLSGGTKYTNCVSHKWVVESVVRKKHGRLGSIFQSHLFDNTLLATIWIGIFIGMAGVFVSLLLLRSIEVAGLSVFILLGGTFIILGPGGVKVSEEFLVDLQKYSINELCPEDYSYVRIAHDEIVKWLRTSMILGATILALSPFAQMIPEILAFSITIFTQYFIWGPAMVLMELWFPLAFAYMIFIIPFFLYIIFRFIRAVRGSPEESDKSGYQW